MNPLDTIHELQAKGATVEARGDRLRVVAPKGVLMREHADMLKRNKRLLMAALSGHHVTLAEYGEILNEAITSPDMPPLPPFWLAEPEYAVAWSTWWDAVERQRQAGRA